VTNQHTLLFSALGSSRSRVLCKVRFQKHCHKSGRIRSEEDIRCDPLAKYCISAREREEAFSYYQENGENGRKQTKEKSETQMRRNQRNGGKGPLKGPLQTCCKQTILNIVTPFSSSSEVGMTVPVFLSDPPHALI